MSIFEDAIKKMIENHIENFPDVDDFKDLESSVDDIKNNVSEIENNVSEHEDRISDLEDGSSNRDLTELDDRVEVIEKGAHTLADLLSYQGELRAIEASLLKEGFARVCHGGSAELDEFVSLVAEFANRVHPRSVYDPSNSIVLTYKEHADLMKDSLAWRATSTAQNPSTATTEAPLDPKPYDPTVDSTPNVNFVKRHVAPDGSLFFDLRLDAATLEMLNDIIGGFIYGDTLNTRRRLSQAFYSLLLPMQLKQNHHDIEVNASRTGLEFKSSWQSK